MATADDADGMEVTEDSPLKTHPKQVQPFARPKNKRGHPGWKGEMRAARAKATDDLKWIVFDSSTFDPSMCGAKLEKFLQMFPPSVIESSDGVGWISVHGPTFPQRADWKKEDRTGLLKSWEALQQSGQPINFDTVQEIAIAHKCISGKWHFHIDTGVKIDHAWATVAKTVVSGQSGMSAKVNSHESNKRGDNKHVICVYNRDFTDEDQIFQLEDSLRKVGIKCGMVYKPDAYTYLGIYSGNKWKIKPFIYKSEYDLNLGKSKVTAMYLSELK